ncbi:hypothetical protein M0R45_038282 [Rubus argutus]|uniref:J domain-containing protein n=1 Tax=Rubus argutus TaxID=59490 RepID=A0AAW1W2K4_RUBAR
MAALEENNALFPIFILTIMALALVPYTILKLCRAASKQTRASIASAVTALIQESTIRPFFKAILNFSTYSSLPLVLLWVVMIVLVYYITTQSVENQVFYPYHILGLKPGAPDSEIKKAYRKLSVLYHPEKNPDPEATKDFVEKIVKTYQALTDPVSRENYEKYGHPDGRQGFEMGIAPLQFLLDTKRNGGILFLGIVGVDILLLGHS